MSEFQFLKNQKGFTLAEILVVVVIIGILVAIAVPVYANVIVKANQRLHDANARMLHSVAQLYIVKEWDEKEKKADQMEMILKDYLHEGEYPANPTNSGPYEVEISTEGKITVRPGIGQYASPTTGP